MTKAYFIPDWDEVSPNNVLEFPSLEEAEAFVARRNDAINVGEAVVSHSDAVNFRDELWQLALDYGFHRLTPQQRDIISKEVKKTGVAPPLDMVIPDPSKVQRTIAKAQNETSALRATLRINGQNDQYLTNFPDDEKRLRAMIMGGLHAI